MNDVLLIIPAYNEEDSIVSLMDKVEKYPQYDYLVIDDGSTDHTLSIIEKHEYHHVRNIVNRGITETMRIGMRYALEKGYKYAVQIDADGQNDPAYIGRVAAKADEGYDIVIGSRLIGKKKLNMGIARKTGSTLLKGAIRLRTGQTITDPTSGMRLYDRKALRFMIRHPECGPEPSGIAWMIRSGAKVAEVPVVMHDRAYGKSYLTFHNASRYMLRELFGILR